MLEAVVKWEWLKKRLVKVLIEEINKNKPKQLAQTEFIFVDPNGKRYYQYQNLWDMPVCRKQKLEILTKEHQERMSFYDVKTFIKAGKAILEKNDSVIQKIGYWLGVMEDKANMLFHPYTFLEMAACLIICEDQDPSIWDEEYEAKKIENFKIWSKSGGGLHDFFTQIGLGEYFPFLTSMGSEFNKYFENAELMNRKYLEAMKSYINKSSE